MTKFNSYVLLRSVVVHILVLCSLSAREPERSTLCEILPNLDRLNGKVVKTVGRLIGSEEATWIVPYECEPHKTRLVRSGREFGYSLHVESISAAALFDRAGKQLTLDQAEALWSNLRRQWEENPKIAIVGEFEGRLATTLKRIEFNGGEARIFGFGHLGLWPAGIEISAIRNLRVVVTHSRK